ncbi:SET domain-containing protein [Collimonas sp. OK412]|jgi:hypothetical protein|uniref:SET domain-containing protein n=1 Tax=Collimonas sp. (strain OK412) TaxID=1801619 RepID=UPI0008EFB96B|nr:SET domain-containing protein [Collimonas sp. OK412]SFC95468.1 hypothetical protein SAMN04515619_11762 [Collimonas sp. OK412]
MSAVISISENSVRASRIATECRRLREYIHLRLNDVDEFPNVAEQHEFLFEMVPALRGEIQGILTPAMRAALQAAGVDVSWEAGAQVEGELTDDENSIRCDIMDNFRGNAELERACEMWLLVRYGAYWLLKEFHGLQVHCAIERLPYSPELDGRYPFRDAESRPVMIRKIWQSQPTASGEVVSADAVWPLIDPLATAQARMAHYHSMLQCRLIEAGDLQDPRESSLLGERGVFTVRPVQKGECVGVYGGRLMTPAMYFMLRSDSFAISSISGAAVSFLDGENILAMMNTSLEYDESGRCARQSPDAYNVEPVAFDVESDIGGKFSIRAFFATRDIPAGVELRWNYRYSDDMVRQVFGRRL